MTAVATALSESGGGRRLGSASGGPWLATDRSHGGRTGRQSTELTLAVGGAKEDPDNRSGLPWTHPNEDVPEALEPSQWDSIVLVRDPDLR